MKASHQNNIIALKIEIENLNSICSFQFNETMLHAIQSSLRVAYREVFIWSADTHIGVWVVGSTRASLISSFINHIENYKTIEVLESLPAQVHFQNILRGVSWNACSMVARAESFVRGYEMSKGLDCLGPMLSPLVADGFNSLNNNALITGAQNAYSVTEKIYDFKNSESEKHKLMSSHLFYRLCIN